MNFRFWRRIIACVLIPCQFSLPGTTHAHSLRAAAAAAHPELFASEALIQRLLPMRNTFDPRDAAWMDRLVSRARMRSTARWLAAGLSIAAVLHAGLDFNHPMAAGLFVLPSLLFAPSEEGPGGPAGPSDDPEAAFFQAAFGVQRSDLLRESVSFNSLHYRYDDPIITMHPDHRFSIVVMAYRRGQNGPPAGWLELTPRKDGLYYLTVSSFDKEMPWPTRLQYLLSRLRSKHLLSRESTEFTLEGFRAVRGRVLNLPIEPPKTDNTPVVEEVAAKPTVKPLPTFQSTFGIRPEDFMRNAAEAYSEIYVANTHIHLMPDGINFAITATIWKVAGGSPAGTLALMPAPDGIHYRLVWGSLRSQYRDVTWPPILGRVILGLIDRRKLDAESETHTDYDDAQTLLKARPRLLVDFGLLKIADEDISHDLTNYPGDIRMLEFLDASEGSLLRLSELMAAAGHPVRLEELKKWIDRVPVLRQRLQANLRRAEQPADNARTPDLPTTPPVISTERVAEEIQRLQAHRWRVDDQKLAVLLDVPNAVTLRPAVLNSQGAIAISNLRRDPDELKPTEVARAVKTLGEAGLEPTYTRVFRFLGVRRHYRWLTENSNKLTSIGVSIPTFLRLPYKSRNLKPAASRDTHPWNDVWGLHYVELPKEDRAARSRLLEELDRDFSSFDPARKQRNLIGILISFMTHEEEILRQAGISLPKELRIRPLVMHPLLIDALLRHLAGEDEPAPNQRLYGSLWRDTAALPAEQREALMQSFEGLREQYRRAVQWFVLHSFPDASQLILLRPGTGERTTRPKELEFHEPSLWYYRTSTSASFQVVGPSVRIEVPLDAIEAVDYAGDDSIFLDTVVFWIQVGSYQVYTLPRASNPEALESHWAASITSLNAVENALHREESPRMLHDYFRALWQDLHVEHAQTRNIAVEPFAPMKAIILAKSAMSFADRGPGWGCDLQTYRAALFEVIDQIRGHMQAPLKVALSRPDHPDAFQRAPGDYPQEAVDRMLDWIERALELGAPELNRLGDYLRGGQYEDHPSAPAVIAAYQTMRQFRIVDRWKKAFPKLEQRRALQEKHHAANPETQEEGRARFRAVLHHVLNMEPNLTDRILISLEQRHPVFLKALEIYRENFLRRFYPTLEEAIVDTRREAERRAA